MLKKIVTSLVSFLMVLISTSAAFACACCVERGYYYRGREKLDSSRLEMLADVKMTGLADLYMTEAGFDMIKGLPEVEKLDAGGPPPEFRITSSFDRRIWRLSVQAGQGLSGTIVLPAPTHMTMHAADIDGIDTGLGVSLYKEYSLNGRVSTATGILRSARSANYHLMFQGRGNGCESSSDFTRWRLEISGQRADYVFFGKVA